MIDRIVKFCTNPIVRLLFLVFLSLIAFVTYKITMGLDKSFIILDRNNLIEIDKSPWSIKFLNFISLSELKSIADVDSAVNNFTFFVSTLFTIAILSINCVINMIRKNKYDEIRAIFPVETVSVNTVGVEDIRVMASYYRRADFVAVFSGDFSWIAVDNEIKKIIENLVESNKIRFYSSKSRNVVAGSLGREIFDRYLPFFHFNSPAEFKASLVKMQGGAQYLLYNRRMTNEGLAATERSEVIIFENKHSLNEPISKLSSFVFKLSNPKILIMVCGETGAGKTFVASQIQATANAQLISVGNYFRELTQMAGKNPQSRDDVIHVARNYLDRFGPVALADSLISRFDASKDTIVIDGLRPPVSIEALRTRFPNHIVIYVEANESVRAQRCTGFSLNDMDQSIDVMVRPVATSPSVIKIVNNSHSTENLKKLVSENIIGRFPYLHQR